jgi:hypothetical protein
VQTSDDRLLLPTHLISSVRTVEIEKASTSLLCDRQGIKRRNRFKKGWHIGISAHRNWDIVRCERLMSPGGFQHDNAYCFYSVPVSQKYDDSLEGTRAKHSLESHWAAHQLRINHPVGSHELGQYHRLLLKLQMILTLRQKFPSPHLHRQDW